MVDRECENCVFFLGKLSYNPNWKWSHCRAGISNITIDYARYCDYYDYTIQDAIEKHVKEFKKEMGWDKCPMCRGKI